MEESNCSCTVPCTRITYEPALSYAQLSKFSIDRLVLTDPSRRLAVKKQYELATEVLQRQDKAIASIDTATISDIQSKMQALIYTIDTDMMNLASSHWQVDSWIDDMMKALRTDQGFLDEEIEDEVWPQILNVEKEFNQYKQCIDDILTFVRGFHVSLPTMNEVEKHLTECLTIDCDPDGGGGSGGRDSGVVTPEPPATLTEKLAKVPESCMTLVDALDSVLWLPNNYTTSIEGLFAETSSDPSEIPDHLTCLLNLDKIGDDVFVNATQELISKMRLMFANPSQSGLVDVATQLLVQMLNTSASTLGTLHSNAASRCTWPTKHFPVNSREALDDIDKAINSLEDLQSASASFQSDISDIHRIRHQLSPEDTLNDYLAGSITKLEMAYTMQSYLVTQGIEDLLDSEMALDGILRRIDESLRNIETYLQTNFEYLFDLDVPLLNTERIDNLTLMTFARSMGVQEIEVLYQKLGQNYPGHVNDIIHLVTEHLGLPIRTMKENIVNYIVAARKALTLYRKDLNDYEQESQMKQDFFM